LNHPATTAGFATRSNSSPTTSIRNPQSAICNLQSAIRIPQFESPTRYDVAAEQGALVPCCHRTILHPDRVGHACPVCGGAGRREAYLRALVALQVYGSTYARREFADQAERRLAELIAQLREWIVGTEPAPGTGHWSGPGVAR
jgi:hypothetical protein